jgi:hypothetical protein
LYDVVVVFSKIAENDEDGLLGCLIDEDGFLVCIEGILQPGFVEPTILIQVTAGWIAFLRWRRQSRVVSLEDNVSFWGIWCRERIEFDDGNIARQTKARVYVVDSEAGALGDTFIEMIPTPFEVVVL